MRRVEHGFTLVEVLVAMAIIGVAVAPLLVLLPGSLVPRKCLTRTCD
jgi:prepilin-type N-terminal cleavage/methylation domain-containing protein